MGQREVDGLDPVVVFLAFAHIRKTAYPVVRLDAQLVFKWVHEGAEHVQQHALAMLLQDLEDVHVDQRGEDDGFAAFCFCRVIDLPHRLVCLVDGVGERQPHMPRFHVELRQDGVAKSLGRDAGAVRDKKYSAF